MFPRINLHTRSRVLLLLVAVFCFSGLLWGRLLWIQIIDPDHWVSLARRQHMEVLELPPTRGDITDRTGKPLAVTIRLASIFANPRHIKNPQKAAKQLAPLLDQPYEKLLARLSNKKRAFIWLARQVSNKKAKAIQALRIFGIEQVLEPHRVYPQGYLASHLVGFSGIDTQGLEGLEKQYEDLLKGEPGWRWLARDAKQRPMSKWPGPFVAPRDGFELQLTLDMPIQYIVERELDRVMLKHKAKWATVVVLDPTTGEILALANRPTYDPNQYQQAEPDSRRNRAVTDPFEPGSIFKVVTAAMALGTGQVDPNEEFFCEEGEYAVAGRILHDHRPHGWLTFREVMIFSSNIGTAKVAIRMGPEAMYKGMQAFRFGVSTESGIPGEAPGLVKHPKDWSRPSITTIPMGHEVATTALQLVQCIATVANDGKMMQPQLIKAIKDADGRRIKRFRPKVVRRVVQTPVAKELQSILAAVVEEGTAKQAQIEGIRTAGKTGTSQKVEPTGGYSHSNFIASFAGFAPVEDPKLAIVVVVDEPRGTYYGGTVAAPAFKRIAEESLAYLIQQDRMTLPAKPPPQIEVIEEVDRAPNQ